MAAISCRQVKAATRMRCSLAVVAVHTIWVCGEGEGEGGGGKRSAGVVSKQPLGGRVAGRPP